MQRLIRFRRKSYVKGPTKQHLPRDRAVAEAGLMRGLRTILPRLFMLEEEHRLAMVQSERDFTAQRRAELGRGALIWEVDKLRRLAETALDDDLEAFRSAAGETPADC
jgi:hypothetical protein